MKKLIEDSISIKGMSKPDGRRVNLNEYLTDKELTVTFKYEDKSENLMAKVIAPNSEESNNREAEYLARQAQIVRAETEEGDNVVVSRERTKKVPNKEKVTRESQTNSLKLTIPNGLKGQEAKAYVLEQINNHLAS